jgi:hypothetical protein
MQKVSHEKFDVVPSNYEMMLAKQTLFIRIYPYSPLYASIASEKSAFLLGASFLQKYF